MRKGLLIFMGAALVVALLFVGCKSPETLVTEEQSQEIARQFVLNEATFKYDGMEETLKLVATNTLSSPYTWEFVFEFQSRHSGYGDRTGMVLLQVITPHMARIAVKEGKVESAVMDDRWDMMKQKFINS